MNGGRWRSRRCSSGRTSSIVTCRKVPLREDDERRALRLARDVGGGEVALDDPLARVDQDERDVGALAPPRARAAPSSSRSPAAAGACGAGRRCRSAGTSGRRARARCRSRRASCPGTSETIVRSAPISALKSDDLPTFGRPRIATRIASSPTARPRPRRIVLEPRDDLVEQVAGAVCRASPRAGSGRRGRAGGTRARAPPATGRRSCSRARAPACARARRISASSSSPGVTPARASTTSSTRSASATASARLLDDRARDRVACSRRRRRPCRRAGTACRPTRRRAPCGRASSRSSRGRRRRALDGQPVDRASTCRRSGSRRSRPCRAGRAGTSDVSRSSLTAAASRPAGGRARGRRRASRRGRGCGARSRRVASL